MKGSTYIPNELIFHEDLSPYEKIVWEGFRAFADIANWTFHTKHIAEKLNLNVKTVQKAVSKLIKLGFLEREKNGIEITYSIPSKFLRKKSDGKKNCSKTENEYAPLSYAPSGYAPNEYAPPNGVHNNIDLNNIDPNKINLNHHQEGSTDADILNDERMKNDFFEKEEEKNFEERRLQKITIKDLQKGHIDPLTTKNDDSYQENKNLKIEANYGGVSHNCKNSEGQDREREIINDAEFMEFVMAKFPQVKNLHGYLKAPDKVTGKPVYEKIWAEFKNGKEGKPQSSLDYYWVQKLPYDSLQWKKDLPEYEIWLNRARNTKFDDTFVEDNTLGHSRNLRIYFMNWYRYYYKNIDEQLLNNNLPPVNPEFKNLVENFCSNY